MAVVMVEFTSLASLDILGGAKWGGLADLWRSFPMDVTMFTGSSSIHSFIHSAGLMCARLLGFREESGIWQSTFSPVVRVQVLLVFKILHSSKSQATS